MGYRRGRRRRPTSVRRRSLTSKESEAVRNEQIRKLAKRSLATLRSYIDPSSEINLRNAEIAEHEQKRNELLAQLRRECSKRINKRKSALLETAKYSLLRESDKKEAKKRHQMFMQLLPKSKQRTFWGKPTKEAMEALSWIENYKTFGQQVQLLAIEYRKECIAIEHAENTLLNEQSAIIPDIPEKRRIPPEPLVREAIAIREKEEGLKVAAARNADQQRGLASSVIRNLPRNHPCPYCGGELGPTPHADHIYPVSKGGRSTFANLVFVCMTCNGKKSDLTLRAFAKAFEYDYALIEQRLDELGKEF